MMMAASVNEICRLKQEEKKIRKQIEKLEALFFKSGEEALSDSKKRSVTYYGAGGNSVTVTYAQKAEVVYPTVLKKALGASFNDMVKEEIKYKINQRQAQVLAGVINGEVTDESIENILGYISADSKMKKTLLKKVKGLDFVKDINNIENITGLERKEAEEYAYFVAEARNCEDFEKIMKASGRENEMESVTEDLRCAICVSETPKITITMPQDED